MASERVHPTVEAVAEDIESMSVRGAAAIAAVTADALATQADESDAETPVTFRREMRVAARTLRDTRPTAVSLSNALRFVLGDMSGSTVADLRESVAEAASTLRDRLDGAQATLGRIGAGRLDDGDTVMTHCHSTDAIACIEAALDQGTDLSAVVKETRPRLQGHITAEELRELGVPVTLVVDNAARRYLDDADHVLVGADSIAADGSVTNKIGTSTLAVCARERAVPVTVAAQTIKLDPATLMGESVDVEMRDEAEVLGDEARATVGDVTVENPAFDVTPPRFVDAVVTERGQFPPTSLVTLLRELFGEDPTRPWTEG